MPTNELLEEKWEAQRKLAELSGYNIKIMLDNAEKIVNELISKQKIKLKIASLKP
jgi:hypothetical protein